jgi:hypothetical protein
LFNEQELAEPPIKKAKQGSYYGQDGDNDVEVQSVDSGKPHFDFEVNLKAVEERNLSQRRSFLVRFYLTSTLSFQAGNREQKLLAEASDKLQIINFINIGIKNSMMQSLTTFDKKSTYFFPKLSDQVDLMRPFQSHVTDMVTPITGIRECAHLLGNDSLFLMATYCMQWANKKCKILQVDGNKRGGKLLDIEITDVNNPLSLDVIEKFKSELKKVRFHIEYHKGAAWMKRMKEKYNWSDERIQANQVFTKKGTAKLYKPKNNEPNVLSTAHDHKFVCRNFDEDGKEVEKEQSVASYYQEVRGIPLKYPNMPIVRISEKEWFPVEFLIVGK